MKEFFALIGKTWEHYRKNAVLNQVVLWIVFPATTLILILSQFAEPASLEPLLSSPYQGIIPRTPSALILLSIVFLVLSLVLLWGAACVLLTTRRTIAGKSGRNRTSFKVVRREGVKLILPMFCTELLRTCITLLLGLLVLIPLAAFVLLNLQEESPLAMLLPVIAVPLLLPALLYSIRTSFSDVVVVTEDIAYRPALQESMRRVRGHTWRVIFSLIGFSIVLIAPAKIAAFLIHILIVLLDPALLPVAYIAEGGLLSLSSMLFLLAVAFLYADLKQDGNHIKEVKPLH